MVTKSFRNLVDMVLDINWIVLYGWMDGWMDGRMDRHVIDNLACFGGTLFNNLKEINFTNYISNNNHSTFNFVIKINDMLFMNFIRMNTSK